MDVLPLEGAEAALVHDAGEPAVHEPLCGGYVDEERFADDTGDEDSVVDEEAEALEEFFPAAVAATAGSDPNQAELDVGAAPSATAEEIVLAALQKEEPAIGLEHEGPDVAGVAEEVGEAPVEGGPPAHARPEDAAPPPPAAPPPAEWENLSDPTLNGYIYNGGRCVARRVIGRPSSRVHITCYRHRDCWFHTRIPDEPPLADIKRWVMETEETPAGATVRVNKGFKQAHLAVARGRFVVANSSR